MKTRFMMMSLLALASTIVACSSTKERKQEYEFAGSVQELEIPPNMIKPDSKLIMEIPRPSAAACEKLMQADARFQKKKLADEAEAKRKAMEEEQQRKMEQKKAEKEEMFN